ncbi:endonuclease/exonuclease/phosphatase family protein [Rathayibacter sp. VKM Ac-2759]|uniref:endonuclease/exonuclease/phosphatase family protein n=1 Tax=Rathayibacter sp. VKM Ac-2759 TaxID=2609252 RepID=UPI0013191E9E|nr:endonuclease/exonuclease/phosphatase family protein [Rathayibacter sp. VKM Ac-2759]QHC66142.1 endonuclease/exonuclease/phosphatase family protein [Rathayibacter sp. VKM Ac-2759]
MGTRLVKFAVAAAVAIVLIVAAAPGFFGIVRETPFAQLVSFRLATALAAVGVAVVLVVIAVLVRPIRRLALAVGALGLAFALVLAGLQVFRGYDSTPPRAHRLADLRVLSWNVLDTVPVETIAAVAAENAVDALALVEVSPESAQGVADALGAAGLPMTVHYAAGDEGIAGTALLLAASLGTYAVDAETVPTGTYASLVARPDTPDRPVIAAVHAVPPIPGVMDDWSSDLSRLAALCSTEDDVVVLGDLNSTVDHWSGIPGTAALGACSDSGTLANAAAVGTWPTSLPAVLGAPIDHVLFSGRWDVSGYTVLEDHDDAGSDHRPVLAQLSVRGMVKDAS